jgi:uncharacterized protein involved in exopolysaccharide biosynthesis
LKVVTDTLQPQATMAERLRSLGRHRLAIVISLVAGVALTVALALGLPPTFRSTATILIEQQEIPQDLVRSTVTSFADQRVQVISQRVMTSQNLMSIIERYDLYPSERRRKSREAVFDKMRGDIKLKMISANVVDPRSGRPMQATIAFTLSYESGSPDLAVKVANELATLYLNENLTMRTAAARETASFLGSEADALRGDIARLAATIATFKQAHATELPDLGQANFQMLDRTDSDVRDTNNKIDALDRQRVLLDAQLAQLSPTAQIYGESGQRIMSPADRLKLLQAELASLKARYAPDHPDIAKTEREIAGLQTEVSADDNANDLLRRLDSTRAQLAAARERYTADHPDVQRLSREVASLEAQVLAAPATKRVERARTSPDNPAYTQLKASLDSLAVEREGLVRKIDELKRKQEDYERRLSQAPAVERDYRALVRDYDTAQSKYQEVMLKRREAQSAQDLETERKGERFTLIEPPQRPEDPISPNRPALLLLGLLVSCALALGVGAGREVFDGSVRGVRDLTTLVEVAPLAAIPVIETRAEAARRKRLIRYSWQGTVASLAVLLTMVHFLVRPLDLVWLALARRLGL